jgi:RimJ/RimL family protein N-acetyltransferase
MKFRNLILDDLPFLNEVRNQYAKEFLHDSRTFTLSETQVWFVQNKPDFYMILVDDKPIGYFRLSNHSVENRNIYIGADIHPDYTGKGYGYQAYKAFLPFLFQKYDLHKVSLEVLHTNHIAIGLYDKLGFIQEGIKRQEVYKNGVWVDSIIMSILRKDLKSKNC